MPLSEDKFCRARVIERQDFASDLWKIRIEPEAPFRFAAGQYATLGVRSGDKLVERAYSIVSSPYEESVECFIELVPEGDLTPLLFRLNPGDDLKMRKIAKGRFTLDLQSGRTKHLLLCTVTGIAPFVSYVRTLKRDWDDKKFPGEHQLYISERRQPLLGIRLQRGVGKNRRGSAVAQVRHLGEPPMGRRGVARGSGPRGGFNPQVHGPMGDHSRERHRLSLRPPADDRAQHGNFAAARIPHRFAAAGGVLGSGEVNQTTPFCTHHGGATLRSESIDFFPIRGGRPPFFSMI